MMTMTDLPSNNGSDENRDAAMAHLESKLGYTFNDRQHLATALRHRSFIHQSRDLDIQNQSVEDNQRYEFLGDSVLSLSVSTLLYYKFPDIKEGVLSRMRAGLVNELQLAGMAREIGVPEALFLGRGEEATGGRDKNSILADALEALVAAIYLDGGFHEALRVVQDLWAELIARSSRDDLLKDFKTRLQELTQRTLSQTPEYRLTGSHGPDHERTFEVTLFLEGKAVSTGLGGSKKEAEQAAARSALKTLNVA